MAVADILANSKRKFDMYILGFYRLTDSESLTEGLREVFYKRPAVVSFVRPRLCNNKFQYPTIKQVNVNKLNHIQQRNGHILGFSGP